MHCFFSITHLIIIQTIFFSYQLSSNFIAEVCEASIAWGTICLACVRGQMVMRSWHDPHPDWGPQSNLTDLERRLPGQRLPPASPSRHRCRLPHPARHGEHGMVRGGDRQLHETPQPAQRRPLHRYLRLPQLAAPCLCVRLPFSIKQTYFILLPSLGNPTTFSIPFLINFIHPPSFFIYISYYSFFLAVFFLQFPRNISSQTNQQGNIWFVCMLARDDSTLPKFSSGRCNIANFPADPY